MKHAEYDQNVFINCPFDTEYTPLFEDIHQHGNSPREAVTRVRNWLRTESGQSDMPGGAAIYARYEAFRADLPSICSKLKLDFADLTFADLSHAIAGWLREHRPDST